MENLRERQVLQERDCTLHIQVNNKLKYFQRAIKKSQFLIFTFILILEDGCCSHSVFWSNCALNFQDLTEERKVILSYSIHLILLARVNHSTQA